MRKRITAQNLKWTCGWLAVAGLALCWWLPLPLHPAADSGPPWIYGNPEARFTVTLYTNLECPHCRFYLPQLQRWIVTNDHVNLAWPDLPLPQNEPASSREARLLECVGQPEGPEGLWGAGVWVYLHSQSNGQGLATVSTSSGGTPGLQRCLAGEAVAQTAARQNTEASQNGLNATPTLRLIDNHTQHTVILESPIEPDALLSAVDLLSAPELSEMPADMISDMPR